jgi:hypothetical protein
LASPPMKTCRLSHHGAATLPARRSTGATCRGCPRRRPPRHWSVVVATAAGSCVRQDCGLKLTTSSSPCPRGPADGPPSCGAQRTGTPESQRSAPCQADPPRRSKERPASAQQLYDDSDRPDSDSLQRHRSWGKSSDSTLTPSAPQAVDSDAAPRRLHLLLIRGGGAPDVHVSLVAGGGQGPTPTVAEAGGSASERVGVRVAAIEAAD